jgi:hypothetical protein
MRLAEWADHQPSAFFDFAAARLRLRRVCEAVARWAEYFTHDVRDD